MGRRQAREKALQAMFQIDVGKSDPEQALSYADGVELANKDNDFARSLVFGTLEHIEVLDEVISRLSKDWQIDRMPSVDLNIMRLALFEMLHVQGIPPGASINEAVELAKKYGGEDSAKFINGILGKVAENPADYMVLKT